MSSIAKHINIDKLKDADKCVWVKCIRGIAPNTNTTVKKTKALSEIPPHLKEGHVKLTVKKDSPSYKLIEDILSLFSDSQRYSLPITTNNSQPESHIKAP